MTEKKYHTSNNKPKFKPGNKPYCMFGKEVLNANVPWNEIVMDIKEKGYSLITIAQLAETDLTTIQEIIALNFENLPFRSGARLITQHCRLCIDHYDQ